MTASKLFIIVFIWIPIQITHANSWNVNGLKLNTSNQTLNLHVDKISFSQIDGDINNIHYQCYTSKQLYPLHQCEKGRVSFNYLETKYDFHITGWFDFNNKKWDIKLFDDSESLSIQHSSEFQERLIIKLIQMPVTEVLELLKEQLSINNESIGGLLTADLELDFSDLFIVFGNFQLENFNWESESSEYVLADTKILGEFLLRPNATGYELLNSTSIVKGEGLFKDIYLVFEQDNFLLNSVVEINNIFEFNKLHETYK